MNHQEVADGVLRGVGGESNVRAVEHCATRLRFTLADRSKADKAAVESVPGVITVVESGGQFQVVIGNQVGEIYARFGDLAQTSKDTAGEQATSGNFLNRAIELVTSIFTPVFWIIAGSGLLKALLAVGVKIDASFGATTTYAILFTAGDAVFQFLPLFLAMTAARRFKADQFTALAIGGALVYSATIGVVPGPKGASLTLKAFADGGGDVTFLGIPVVMVAYLSSVIPVIVAVYAQSHLERFLKRVLPDALRNFCTPLFTIAVVVPLTFLAIGPVTSNLGDWVSQGVDKVWDVSPIAGGALMGAFWQVFVIFGIHWSFVPVIFQELATNGVSKILGVLFPAVLAQAGAGLAVFLRTRDKQVKALAGPATVSAFLAGITEPVIYGVNLRYKKPFVFACVAGAIGGGIAGASKSAPTSFVLPGGLTLSAPVNVGNYALLLIGVAVAVALAFVLTFVTFKDQPTSTAGDTPAAADEPPAEPAAAGGGTATLVRTKALQVLSPVVGTVVPLTAVPDKVFASGAVGQGAGVNPSAGEVLAPVEATVVTVMPHAYGLRTDDGVEILVHVGIDTVKLEGRHFSPAVTEGTRVRPGDLLVEFDPVAVRAAGYDPVTVVLVTAQAGYTTVDAASGDVRTSDPLLTLQP
ncbi:beta-glucoside-specific PTS transporter subunit IIABC [Streptomyces ipomoeae]|uniref:beta-glucoside-specific PTS transporter subunit IIABC n=1 Tax=Streptomyces ipomoeae TaxID=103232 RepID=UPI0011479ABF|nr:beta-glucoside-specific PTS transporter subunit IIABC [Streptomyces ipomoeae]MDX2933444.1 beta-glucoside-specific PTS transporter subunit IIABC [Streptomyces ipomoeae]TQE20287.1 PTS beta-glucoside transporter subunit IIBCA [Streptomyces ipomoeae]